MFHAFSLVALCVCERLATNGHFPATVISQARLRQEGCSYDLEGAGHDVSHC